MGWEWYRKLYGGLLYLFSPVSSVDVKAWMFANTTKSSSVWNSSRQLYRLNKTVFIVNWSEHWIPFDPRRHPHPSSINFCTLVMIFSFFCTWKSILTLLDSVLLRWDDASGYQGYAFLLVAWGPKSHLQEQLNQKQTILNLKSMLCWVFFCISKLHTCRRDVMIYYGCCLFLKLRISTQYQ